MTEFFAFMTGFFVAVFFGLIVSNHTDDKRVERGWMEQRGKLYLLIPAKAEARQ